MTHNEGPRVGKQYPGTQLSRLNSARNGASRAEALNRGMGSSSFSPGSTTLSTKSPMSGFEEDTGAAKHGSC